MRSTPCVFTRSLNDHPGYADALARRVALQARLNECQERIDDLVFASSSSASDAAHSVHATLAADPNAEIDTTAEGGKSDRRRYIEGLYRERRAIEAALEIVGREVAGQMAAAGREYADEWRRDLRPLADDLAQKLLAVVIAARRVNGYVTSVIDSGIPCFELAQAQYVRAGRVTLANDDSLAVRYVRLLARHGILEEKRAEQLIAAARKSEEE